VNVVRSEWIKLRTVQSSIVLLLLALAVPFAFAVLIGIAVPIDEQTFATVPDRFTLATAGLGTSQLLMAVLGVLVYGQEHRSGSIRVTYAVEPRRWRVHLAKAAVAGFAALLVGVVTVVPSFLVASAIFGLRGGDIGLSDRGVPAALAGAIVVGAGHALIGVALGALLRQPAGPIVLVILWPQLVEGILVAAWPSGGRYLPFRAGQALASVPGTDRVLPALGGGAIYLATIAALFVVGGAVVARRDT
jgi:ABC-type transport system involved in multi-copper enzyme maturation permease subunit